MRRNDGRGTLVGLASIWLHAANCYLESASTARSEHDLATEFLVECHPRARLWKPVIPVPTDNGRGGQPIPIAGSPIDPTDCHSEIKHRYWGRKLKRFECTIRRFDCRHKIRRNAHSSLRTEARSHCRAPRRACRTLVWIFIDANSSPSQRQFHSFILGCGGCACQIRSARGNGLALRHRGKCHRLVPPFLPLIANGQE
jgi:hypothetical protein